MNILVARTALIAFSVAIAGAFLGAPDRGDTNELTQEDVCQHAIWPLIPARCLRGSDGRDVRLVGFDGAASAAPHASYAAFASPPPSRDEVASFGRFPPVYAASRVEAVFGLVSGMPAVEPVRVSAAIPLSFATEARIGNTSARDAMILAGFTDDGSAFRHDEHEAGSVR